MLLCIVQSCKAPRASSHGFCDKQIEFKMSSVLQKFKRNEEIQLFIAEYQKEECLWNSRLSSYKDKNARQASIARLVSKFNMTETEVKAKINSLRTYFSKEIVKMKNGKNGNGSDRVYQSKWPYFNSLSFLRSTVVPRKSILNIGPSSTQSPSTFIKIEETQEVEDEDGDKEGESLLDESVKRPLGTKRARKDIYKRRENNLQEKALDIPVDQNPTKSEDADDTFCKSVANGLREIENKRAKALAKLKIQEILFHAQTGDYDSPTPTQHQFYLPHNAGYLQPLRYIEYSGSYPHPCASSSEASSYSPTNFNIS